MARGRMRWSLMILALLVLAQRMLPAEEAPSAGGIRFLDASKPSGLADALAGIMGHGAAVGDFDGDSRVDIFVGGFCDRPDGEYAPAAGPVSNRLLRNLGRARFERAEQPAVESFARTSGAVFADLDNDGLPELYVANNAKGQSRRSTEPQRSAQLQRSQLFQNRGGQFADISASSGATPADLYTARNVGVFDYDGDGLLDLLVVEDRFRGGTPQSRLLRNAGGLRFEDATAEAGLPPDIFGLGLAAADLNNDLRPDFFVPHSNRMFLSRGDGTYYEPARLRETFAWKPLHGEDWPCGAALGDLNHDGRLDLVLAIHCDQARNRLYLNEGLDDGVPRFRDVTREAGLGQTVPAKCPHVEIQDFDNDGRPDIYTTAAWLDEAGTVTPLIYRNVSQEGGVPRFEPPQAIGDPMVYFPAGPTADFDDDGRLDLLLVNWFRNNHCRLLLNDQPERHWLKVRVVGSRMNRMGIGAQVRIYRPGELGRPEGLLGYQEICTGYGYASGQVAECHYGLGDHAAVDVSVRLPDGVVIERREVAAKQRLLVQEP